MDVSCDAGMSERVNYPTKKDKSFAGALEGTAASGKTSVAPGRPKLGIARFFLAGGAVVNI